MCYRENRQVIWFSYLENAILASIKKESRKTVQAGACTVFCFMVKFSHKCAENRIFHTNHAGRIKENDTAGGISGTNGENAGGGVPGFSESI